MKRKIILLMIFTLTLMLTSCTKIKYNEPNKLGKLLSSKTTIVDKNLEDKDARDPILLGLVPPCDNANCYSYYYETTNAFEKGKLILDGYISYDPRMLGRIFSSEATIFKPTILIANIKSKFLATKYHYYYYSDPRDDVYSNYRAISVLGVLYSGFQKNNANLEEYYSPFCHNQSIEEIDGFHFPYYVKPFQTIFYQRFYWYYNKAKEEDSSISFTEERYEKYTKIIISGLEILESFDQVVILIDNETNELVYEKRVGENLTMILKKTDKYSSLLDEHEKLISRYEKQIDLFNYQVIKEE